MKQLPRVRCLLGPADARWYGIRIEHRLIVMGLPKRDRRWNPNIRAWVTPTYVIATLPEWLEAVGYEVVVIDVSRHIEPRDWHAEFRRVLGYDCPHRKKKAVAQPPAVDLGHLEAAA